jgi:E3 ubiquitin-protein ligase DZIP3
VNHSAETGSCRDHAGDLVGRAAGTEGANQTFSTSSQMHVKHEGFVQSHRKQAKNSFEKIMDFLTRMFPTYNKTQITQFIQDLRQSRNGSLSGMALEEIVQNVAELIHQDQRHRLSQAGMNINYGGVPKSMLDIDIFEEEEDPCVICHDEMNPGDTITLECQHCFHNQCIRTWLREQSTCPTCRVHALLPDEFPSLG